MDMRALALTSSRANSDRTASGGLLSAQERSMLASVGEERRFPRQATLIRAAAPGSCVAILISGRVRVQGEDCQRVVAMREATVVAINRVHALVVAAERLDQVIAEHPGVLRLLGAAVSKRLRESDAATLGRRGNALDEVVRFLVHRSAGGPVVYINSQSELARELDISRASVGRALAHLRRNELIVVGRSRIRFGTSSR